MKNSRYLQYTLNYKQIYFTVGKKKQKTKKYYQHIGVLVTIPLFLVYTNDLLYPLMKIV